MTWARGPRLLSKDCWPPQRANGTAQVKRDLQVHHKRGGPKDETQDGYDNACNGTSGDGAKDETQDGSSSSDCEPELVRSSCHAL